MSQDGIMFQRWTTLTGDTAAQQMIQDQAGWLDTKGFKRLVLSAQVMQHTNVTLTIETAATLAGPWNTAATIAATGTTYIQAEENATNKLERFVRWKVVSSDVTWTTCFWFGAELKE